MNRHLLSYRLDPPAFHAMMEETDTVFSGSGALALYLEQEGMNPGFVPNDMDLWLDGTDLYQAEEDVDRWIALFARSGYELARETREMDAYMEHLTRIQRVVTMECRTGYGHQKKTIQLIVVRLKEGDSLYDYIANYFDLSACMTWWGQEERRFYTIYPHLTRAKQFFFRRNFLSMMYQVRLTERLQKYEGRGFTVVEEPPPFWDQPDERKEADLLSWEGVQAFDVWRYEDVNAREHLQGGDQKILMGCGGTWQAYDRKELVKYMEGRGIEQGEGWYDTPYRQTVIYDAWESLRYSDYSIYQLVNPEVRGIRTVYAVEAYSARAWCMGEPLVLIGKESALPQEEEEQEQEQEEQEQEEQEQEEQEQEQQDDEDEELLRVLEQSLLLPDDPLPPLEDLLAEPEPLPDAPPAPPAPPALSARQLEAGLVQAGILPYEEHLHQQVMEWFQVEVRYPNPRNT